MASTSDSVRARRAPPNDYSRASKPLAGLWKMLGVQRVEDIGKADLEEDTPGDLEELVNVAEIEGEDADDLDIEEDTVVTPAISDTPENVRKAFDKRKLEIDELLRIVHLHLEESGKQWDDLYERSMIWETAIIEHPFRLWQRDEATARAIKRFSWDSRSAPSWAFVPFKHALTLKSGERVDIWMTGFFVRILSLLATTPHLYDASTSANFKAGLRFEDVATKRAMALSGRLGVYVWKYEDRVYVGGCYGSTFAERYTGHKANAVNRNFREMRTKGVFWQYGTARICVALPEHSNNVRLSSEWVWMAETLVNTAVQAAASSSGMNINIVDRITHECKATSNDVKRIFLSAVFSQSHEDEDGFLCIDAYGAQKDWSAALLRNTGGSLEEFPPKTLEIVKPFMEQTGLSFTTVAKIIRLRARFYSILPLVDFIPWAFWGSIPAILERLYDIGDIRRAFIRYTEAPGGRRSESPDVQKRSDAKKAEKRSSSPEFMKASNNDDLAAILAAKRKRKRDSATPSDHIEYDPHKQQGNL